MVVATMLRRRGRSPVYARNDWAALRYIDETTIPTAQGFAEYHGISKTTVGPVIEQLVKSGFIERRTCPEDKRVKLLSLTPSGKVYLRKDPLNALARRFSNRISPQECDVVGSAICLLSSQSQQWFIDECPICARARNYLETTTDARDRRRRAKNDAIHAQNPYSLIRALYLISSCINKAGATQDMMRREWDALRYFNTAKPSVATLPAFSSHQGITPAAASLTITDLIDKGYLEKQKNPDHPRSPRIAVTAAGRTLARRDPNSKIAAVLASEFNSDELAVIGRAMAVIVKRPPT